MYLADVLSVSCILLSVSLGFDLARDVPAKKDKPHPCIIQIFGCNNEKIH